MDFVRRNRVSFFLAAVFLVLVIWLKPNYGLIKGHTGWVGGHNVAIAKNTGLKTAFVGYTWAFKNEDGSAFYEYFARSPIFSYILMNLAQRPFAQNTADEIVNTRHFMNFVTFLAFALSFLLVYKISGQFYAAGAATLMAFSSQYFLLYKDMPSPDVLTNLGFVTCIWGIYFFEKNRRLAGLGLILLSLNLGWGYSQLPILGLWAGWSFFKDRKIASIFTDRKVAVFLASIFLIFMNLAHNVFHEARVNRVPITEAGILASAKYRLSADSEFNQAHPYPFYRYIPKIISRVHRGFSLPEVDAAMVVTATPLFLFLLYGLFRFLKQPVYPAYFIGEDKMLLLLLLFSGFLWALPMKSLFVYHGYTSMSFFGFTVVGLFFAITQLLKTEKKRLAAFIFCAAYFIGVHSWHNGVQKTLAEPTEHLVQELSRIESYLEQAQASVICVEPQYHLVEGSNYAAAVFLSGRFISKDGHCEYRISRAATNADANLIAENKNIFLTKVQR